MTSHPHLCVSGSYCSVLGNIQWGLLETPKQLLQLYYTKQSDPLQKLCSVSVTRLRLHNQNVVGGNELREITYGQTYGPFRPCKDVGFYF